MRFSILQNQFSEQNGILSVVMFRIPICFNKIIFSQFCIPLEDTTVFTSNNVGGLCYCVINLILHRRWILA